MKAGTIFKLGSLAFNVARDEKLRELFTIIHKGAKRRGLYSPPEQMHHPIIPRYRQDLWRRR